MDFNILTYVDQTVWWIIPTNGHYGILEEGEKVTSIHTFEQFNNEADFLARLDVLGIQIEDSSNDINNSLLISD
jgi:hypothetical protein